MESPQAFSDQFVRLMNRINSSSYGRIKSAPEQEINSFEGTLMEMVSLFGKVEVVDQASGKTNELMEKTRMVIRRSEDVIAAHRRRHPRKAYKKAICWNNEVRSLTREIAEINKEIIDVLPQLMVLHIYESTLRDSSASTPIQLFRVSSGDHKIRGSVSYGNIPCYLWPCICYLLLFPAKFEIPARRLIVLWVAEGLVHPGEDGKRSAEHVAKRYLDKLIDLKVISAKKKLDGNVKSCQLNDARRDDLSKMAKKCGFFNCNGSGFISRLVDHHGDQDPCFIHIDGSPIFSASMSHYRDVLSFLSFDTQEGSKPGVDIGDFLQKCISAGCFRRMRVLDLEQVFRPKLPKALSELTLLRYLGLRWTYLEQLPDFVNKLFNLQVLDVKHTNISVLPKSIWQMQSLRHLYLSEIYRTRFDIRPSDQMSLTGLQTLWGAFIDENTKVKGGLGTLKEIRKLGLSCRAISSEDRVLEDNLIAVAQWISALIHLETLRLQSRDVHGNPYLLLLNSLEKHKELSTVYLVGKLEQSIVSAFPKNLNYITLSGSDLQMDPMGSLGSLEHLKILRLLAKSVTCKKMHCSSGGFPVLRVLYIWMLDDLEEWEIDGGSLPSLQELEIRSCPNLKMLPDQLQTVNSLQIIKLTKMKDEFLEETKSKQPAVWNKVEEKLKMGDDEVILVHHGNWVEPIYKNGKEEHVFTSLRTVSFREFLDVVHEAVKADCEHRDYVLHYLISTKDCGEVKIKIKSEYDLQRVARMFTTPKIFVSIELKHHSTKGKRQDKGPDYSDRLKASQGAYDANNPCIYGGHNPVQHHYPMNSQVLHFTASHDHEAGPSSATIVGQPGHNSAPIEDFPSVEDQYG